MRSRGDTSCPTSPSSLRDATSPSRGGFGRPLGFSSSPEALLLGELSSDSETERLYGRCPCPRSGCFRFRDPSALPQTKQLLCPTSPSSLRDATSPSRGGFGRPLGFISSPEAPLLGELSSDSETERLYGRCPCPGSGCFRFRNPEILPQTKPLLCPTSPSSLRDATSPSRGGFGRPLGFSSSPEALLPGELSA